MSATMLPAVSKVVTVNSTTLMGVPFTGWVRAATVKEVQALVEVLGGGSEFRAAASYRTATTDPTVPNAWTALEGTPAWVASGGKDATEVVDIATAIAGDYWIQFGCVVKLNTGSTLANGDVTLTVTVRC